MLNKKCSTLHPEGICNNLLQSFAKFGKIHFEKFIYKGKEYLYMNNTISYQQPAFRANIEGKFLDAADGYLKNQSKGQYKQFCSAVRRFSEIPNSDHLTITYRKGFENGVPSHILYAKEEGKAPIVLTKKDQFRKLIQKFSFMNEYEFKVKTGLIKKQ